MDIATILISAALAAHVPPDLMLAVCWTESRHKSGALNIHDGGSPSYGLCQVKLATAKTVEKNITPGQLLNPVVNARIAAHLLARNFKRYRSRWSCAVVAYNRGNADNICHRFDSFYFNVNTKYHSRVMDALVTKPWKAGK